MKNHSKVVHVFFFFFCPLYTSKIEETTFLFVCLFSVLLIFVFLFAFFYTFFTQNLSVYFDHLPIVCYCTHAVEAMNIDKSGILSAFCHISYCILLRDVFKTNFDSAWYKSKYLLYKFSQGKQKKTGSLSLSRVIPNWKCIRNLRTLLIIFIFEYF